MLKKRIFVVLPSALAQILLFYGVYQITFSAFGNRLFFDGTTKRPVRKPFLDGSLMISFFILRYNCSGKTY